MDFETRRSREHEPATKELQTSNIPLISEKDNYLGLDTRPVNTSFMGWVGSFFSKNDAVQYSFWNWISGPKTWISSDTSKRTAIKRKAYEVLSQNPDKNITITIPAENDQTAQKSVSVRMILNSLSDNTVEEERSGVLGSSDETVRTLFNDLQQEDRRVFNEFERTLSDAAPNGMVGTFIQGRRNPHLAHILSTFTLLYANSPEKNPLLHNAKVEQNPGDFLRTFRNKENRWSVLDRRAIEGYMDKIQWEITKLIAMPPEAFDMAFSEDNLKHKTITKVLKRAFNRLAAEIDYEFRFKNSLNGFGYEVQPTPVHVNDMKAGVLYYDDTDYTVLDAQNHPITMPHNIPSNKIPAADSEDFPIFKATLLRAAAQNGHVFAEKSNEYVAANNQRKTEADHKKLRDKLSWRTTKKVLFWTAAIFAIIIAAGQVAIAVFAATGSLAVAIGISCAVTNTILFWRDIAGVLIAFARGDLTYGMSWKLKVFLGIFFSFSLATGIISGGFAFSALVALTGSTIATASTIALIGTGFIAALTIVGMTSLFFMVGVGFAKGLRDKTFSQVAKENWTAFKEFFTKTPEYNHELVKLQYEVTNLMSKNGGEAYDYEVHKEILKKRKQIALLKFEHHLRAWLRVIFAVPLALAALIGTCIAAFAISKASVDGTAKLIQLALKWSEAASLAVAVALSWVPGFAVNFGLTLKNLTNVSLLIGAKVAQVTAGVFYGVGMVGVLLTSGRFFRTIIDSAKFYWNNPAKEVLLPSSRIILALGVLVLVFLNGYGNGATLGQQGAFSLEWLPTRMLSWLERLAPATMASLQSSFGIVTTVVGNASSDALNAGACLDFTRDYSLLSAPIGHMEVPVEHRRVRETEGQVEHRVEMTHVNMVQKLKEPNGQGISFFDQRCNDYDRAVEANRPQSSGGNYQRV